MIKVQAMKNGAAEILIYDPIGADWFGNGVTAKRFIDDLAQLGDINDILIRINSPGGEVFDGFAIYNALKNHKAKILVQIDGLAASIASVIAMAGDVVTMGEGAMLMIHDPWSLAVGDAEDMRAQADMLDKVKEGILDAYARRTGSDRDELSAQMDAETWFTAAEAIAAGFADKRQLATDQDDMGAAASSIPSAETVSWACAMAQYRNTPEDFNLPQEDHAGPQSATAGATPKEKTMKNPKAPASVPTADEIRKAAEKKSLMNEQKRRDEIRASFGKFSEQHRDLIDTCLDDMECTADQAKTRLLAKLAEGAEPMRQPGYIEPGVCDREKFVKGAAQAIMVRSGLAEREAGNEFNGMTLHALAGISLSRAGVSVRGLSPDAIARKVLGSLTTSDFPQLLGNTAGKVLRNAYSAFPSTWASWCSDRPVSDFKQVKNIQMGAFNNLTLKPEAAEYDYGDLAEEYETNIAVTKGQILPLSREMIVNDDLGGFNRRAQFLGNAAARTVNSDAYAVLTDNAALIDGIVLFHANHSNLAGSGAAISVATLSAGKAAMRKQKDVGSREYLNIMPAHLLVPVALEDTANEIIRSATNPSQANPQRPNVLRNFVDVISDPKLDEDSATAWYLTANPMVTELVQAVFLDGQKTPFVDDDVDFDTDALRFKVRLDYGFAAVDFRAGWKNAGA